MTLPTDQTSVASVGGEDGVPPEASVLAHLQLSPPQRFTLPCYQCGKASEFLAQFEFPQGLWGVCLGCGEERLVPYTRTVEE